MAKEITSHTDFIPQRDIEMIGVHPVFGYYLIMVKGERMWYAREFIATPEGLTGKFQEDRF